MDIIAEIRRRHLVSGESISLIARSLNISRPTVRKHLKTVAEPAYQRQSQSVPKLGEFKPLLTQGWKLKPSYPKSNAVSHSAYMKEVKPTSTVWCIFESYMHLVEIGK